MLDVGKNGERMEEGGRKRKRRRATRWCAIQVEYKKQLLVGHAEKKKKSVPVVR